MKRKVAFRDLRLKRGSLRKKYLDAIERVYDHGRMILGPEIEALEERLAIITGRKYASTVNSGTLALTVVLKYLSREVGSKKDKVILPSISWVATAQSVLSAGLEPIFVDTDEGYFISLAGVERYIERGDIAAVIAVDFTGYTSSRYKELVDLCSKSSVYLIQDSAQSFGAWYELANGKRIGSCKVGYASCLSINSMKLLASHGEGGALLTDDEDLKKFADAFRYQGCIDRFPVMYGINGRMETMQAAITLVSLDEYEGNIDKRRGIADFYSAELSEVGLGLPLDYIDTNKHFHTYYTYQIQAVNKGARNHMRAYLSSLGIETQLQYEYTLDTLEHLKGYTRDKMIESSRLANTSLCIPCHEAMDREDAEYVVQSIRHVLSQGH